MQILTIDIGTGTQDIFLFDARLDPENGYKLVVPSPTMIVHHRIREATRKGEGLVLTGVTMGGGPSQWAAEAHIQAGLPLYATPDAARSFNDDLDVIREMGIQLVSEDEAAALASKLVKLELKDIDLEAIAQTFARFNINLGKLEAIAVAAFDHGEAPPDVSDRLFRFNYLDERIRQKNSLSAFAYLSQDIPASLTRLIAIKRSVENQYSAHLPETPLILMDTAPAAVLGATLDPLVGSRSRTLILNVGNFHTLAFRMGPTGIEGVFEHHTGLLDLQKLEGLLLALADGSLTNEYVFNDQGHGALIYHSEPLLLHSETIPVDGANGVVVTGPRRAMMQSSSLQPYFPAPYGDMMLTGCFGLLAAAADLLPLLREPILSSLGGGRGKPPWEIFS